MAQGRFNWFDVILTTVSLLTLLLDVGTDIIVTVQLYLVGDVVWGSLMLAFTAVPLVVMNAFSLKWHSTDGSLTCPTVLLHVFLLAPIQRYLRVLWLGFKSCLTGHPRFTDAALRGQNDASILRLFETFLESAPQLVLQLYIILKHPSDFSWIQGLSAGSSLVSLAWALTAYCDTSRLTYQNGYQRRFLALTVHCFWHLFMTTSRIAALVVFASIFKAWICLFAGIHWLIMTIWIWVKGTDFGKGKVEQCLFRMVSGFIYIFVYLNVHNGPTRSRMTFYYCLVLLENAVLFAVWVIYGVPAFDMKIGVASVVFGGFVLGGLFMMVYYRWLHPSGPNYLFTVKSTLPVTQSQRSQSPKERRRPQAANITADSPNGNGSTLELSIESGTPAREPSQQARGGNTTLSQLLHSASRGALESAWQSGMQSSSSSSSSSLDADDCSLDAFNLTSKSSHSTTLLGKSRSSQNTSQSKVSSSTVKSRRSDSATAQRTTAPPANPRGLQSGSSSVHVVDSGQPSSPSVISERSETGSVRERFHSEHSNQSEAPSARERVSESEQQELLDGVLREEADGTEAVAESLTPTNRSRSRLSGNRSNLSTSFFDQASGGSVHEHSQSTLALSREHVTAASRLDPVTAHNLSIELRMASTSLSPLDISRLWSESQSRLGHSSASDVVPADRTTRRADRLSRSFELGESPMMSPDCGDRVTSHSASFRQSGRESMATYGESPMMSPDCAGLDLESGDRVTSRNASFRQSGRESMAPYVESPMMSPESGDRVTSRSASFRQSGRESMAPYPDLVEPMSPEPQEGYGGGAGGESMWSPNLSTNNTSTSSSSHGQDPGLSAQASASRLPRLADSFDSESEPGCLNTMNLQALRSTGRNSPLQRQIENRRLEQLKRSLAAESPGSDASMSPVAKDDSGETSWSSMNVNEDELSGLQNLTSLTPDDSICSFASSDRDERRRPTPAAARQAARGGQQHGTESGIISGASTPSLPRSRSTSSLYHDFTSAGVSPSPPPGLRAAARLSRNQSWVDSPSQQREQLADTPMRLDYLNLDPAPPVERESYFQRHDPREVVIELLMDQLKRASLRSNHSRTESARLSPLTMSHLQESPQRFGRNVDLFDRQAWRSLFGQDPNATLVSNPEPPRRRSARTDLDLMREALDLIEMQRSPYSFRRGTGTPDSASPEMYVSGQYRPPIIAQEREPAARGSVPPLVRGQERRRSRSRLEESLIHAVAVDKSSSLPRQSPAYRPDPTRHAPGVPSEVDSRRRSLPAGEREGLYRYFVDSDSPIHTPLWNTPLTTPAVTPAQRHLLQRYLANNHVASAPRDDRLHSTDARSLREANIEAARLSTTLPHDQPGRRSASRRLSDKLDTAADHPDSGMHSGSQSSASHRQPLQSLDNSPSLSPSSSVTQLPIRAKPASQQYAMTKSSSGRARSSSGTRSSGAVVSSGQPSQGDRQGSPKQKHSSVRPRPHPAYRHGDCRSATDFSAPQGPVSSRAKSSDCLR